MLLNNLTFEQWKKNHSFDHEDKWYRELYPFHLFKKIDFSNELLDTEQKIEFNLVSYFVIVKKIQLQENERYRSTLEIATFPNSKRQEWKQRKWNTTFQIVYSDNYDFITVFAKKEDPSKDYVSRFMKGNFEKINENRSIPVSELLIKTLILHISEEAFQGGKHNDFFPNLLEGVREIKPHPQFIPKEKDFTPIYSLERDTWICYSFNEEKAHRLAFYISNQCRRLIIVYCNPTYTRHHRCTYDMTSIFSLYEYSNLISSEVRKKYENQIRFLQNHLNQHEEHDSKELLNEICNPKLEIYDIRKSDLMEALGIMKIMPITDLDFFHSLSAINLINAFLSQQRNKKGSKSKDISLFKNMYFFKTYLMEIIAKRIEKHNFSIPIYIESDLIIVEIMNFQFSFHNVPLNQTLIKYSKSENNKEIKWSGKRLQPLAPLILNYSRALRKQNAS